MRNPNAHSCLLLVLIAVSAAAAQEPPPVEPNAADTNVTAAEAIPKRPRRKLIEWSAVEPTTAYMREHVREMEQLPFDGLVFHLRTNDNEQMVWNMWGDTSFDADDFSREIADLEATPFARFTERFLRCNVTPGNVDWADDNAWQTVMSNFATAARIVGNTGCRGIMFDTEQYVEQPFAWPPKTRDEPESDPDAADVRSSPKVKPPIPAEITALVQRRGREWIQSINAECPDITILVTYAWRAAQPAEGESFRVHGYELIPAFLDGVMEQASDGTRIVDAWEYSYPYRSRAEFEKGRRSMKQDALQWTCLPDEYAQHVTAGFGLWMDFNVRGHKWHVDDVSLNYNTPDQFRRNLDNAFELTEEYVWIYTSEAKWWTNEALPTEYHRVVEEARAAADR